VSGLSPPSGPQGGGTVVTITGTNFASPAAVSFGGTDATNVKVISAGTITATSPSGTGNVVVTVTTPGGTASSPELFSYLPIPTVTAVSPPSGPQGGGTVVTITGTDFASPATVSFGATAATKVMVVGPTTITATSPPGTGTVNVKVTTPGGTSTTSSADLYRYLAIPAVTKVSPPSGPQGGGTVVTITGTNFASPATVSFGATAATKVTVVSAGKITAASPTGTGTVDVTVTTPGGTSATSSADEFSYLSPPTVSLTPSSGVPASTFNAQLSNFAAAESVEIFFAGNDTGDGCVTDSTGACTVSSVQVPTNLAGGVYTVAADSTSDSAFASFTITPTIALSPSSGTPGSTFNVNGAGFLPDETVSILFGGQATSASCATGTTGTCSVANVQVPATAMAGPVTVTAQGSSSTDSASASFTVLAP
jgi:hypothetical protein